MPIDEFLQPSVTFATPAMEMNSPSRLYFFTNPFGYSGGSRDGDQVVFCEGNKSGAKADVCPSSQWSYSWNGLYQVAPDRGWGFNVSAAINGHQGYPNAYHVQARRQGFNNTSKALVMAARRPDEFRNDRGELNVKPEEVIEMETRMAGGDVALEPQGDDEDEAFTPIAYLADESNEPTRRIEAGRRDWLAADGIGRALEVLDARSRRIVEQRWLVVNDDGSGGMTLHELAAEYGVSAERIRQIEVAALKKMRKALGAQ